jgi:hypothetical protein
LKTYGLFFGIKKDISQKKNTAGATQSENNTGSLHSNLNRIDEEL